MPLWFSYSDEANDNKDLPPNPIPHTICVMFTHSTHYDYSLTRSRKPYFNFALHEQINIQNLKNKKNK